MTTAPSLPVSFFGRPDPLPPRVNPDVLRIIKEVLKERREAGAPVESFDEIRATVECRYEMLLMERGRWR